MPINTNDLSQNNLENYIKQHQADQKKFVFKVLIQFESQELT